jgi:hypothetical protein
MSDIKIYDRVNPEDTGSSNVGDIELGFLDPTSENHNANLDHADDIVDGPSQDEFYHSIFKIVLPDKHKEFFEKIWLPQIFSAASQFKVNTDKKRKLISLF